MFKIQNEKLTLKFIIITIFVQNSPILLKHNNNQNSNRTAIQLNRKNESVKLTPKKDQNIKNTKQKNLTPSNKTLQQKKKQLLT